MSHSCSNPSRSNPHLTVFDNIAFPLRAPKRRETYDGEAIAARVEELTTLVEIDHLTKRFPSELSGGQKQRVALCRALVQEPSIYLLDEPISHLDAQLRHKLRGALRRRLVSLDKPSLWVSPDAMEVVSVADRVVVLIDGVIQQIGDPMAVYRSPSNVQVARLVGDPAMNLITGRLAEDNGAVAFRSAGLTVSIPPGIVGTHDLEGPPIDYARCPAQQNPHRRRRRGRRRAKHGRSLHLRALRQVSGGYRPCR